MKISQSLPLTLISLVVGADPTLGTKDGSFDNISSFLQVKVSQSLREAYKFNARPFSFHS